MLEKLIQMYQAYMLQDVRSPIPHMAGPPGVGKSQAAHDLADLVGVTLHVWNVARMSPLEIEGLEMPVNENTELKMLHSTRWTSLKDGDIVLLDEFLRGFPEVYNGLLDILTSRSVAGYQLPRVFFVAASNSVTAYDPALEDRLSHLLVPDIRNSKPAQKHLSEMLVHDLGLLPEMAKSDEMSQMVLELIQPTYNILDLFSGKARKVSTTGDESGFSARKITGKVRLRDLNGPQDTLIRELLAVNNQIAVTKRKFQYCVYGPGMKIPATYRRAAIELLEKATDRLSNVQRRNLEMNLIIDSIHQAKAAEAEATTEEKEEEA